LRPHATRFLEAMAASVMRAVPVAFDTTALALALGREERPIAEIAYAARLTPTQTAAAVAELAAAGYVVAAGMLAQLTPSGARWWAARQAKAP
jgi:type II secretory pathway component PulJ